MNAIVSRANTFSLSGYTSELVHDVFSDKRLSDPFHFKLVDAQEFPFSVFRPINQFIFTYYFISRSRSPCDEQSAFAILIFVLVNSSHRFASSILRRNCQKWQFFPSIGRGGAASKSVDYANCIRRRNECLKSADFKSSFFSSSPFSSTHLCRRRRRWCVHIGESIRVTRWTSTILIWYRHVRTHVLDEIKVNEIECVGK